MDSLLLVPEEATPTPREVVELPEGTRQFEANGHQYTFREGDPSITRYRVLQRLQFEFGLNLSLTNFVKFQADQTAALNSQDLVTAAGLLFELRKGTIDLSQGRLIGLEICALFFNRAGEDPVAYDHQLMLDKLADWEAAGLGPSFFFNWATVLVPEFRTLYAALSQAISGPQ